jgi:hypothetical protein
MHVLGKSDCAVLPVNQPNKGGQPSAEAGAVRAQTRENIVQSHMQVREAFLPGIEPAIKGPRSRLPSLGLLDEFPSPAMFPRVIG